MSRAFDLAPTRQHRLASQLQDESQGCIIDDVGPLNAPALLLIQDGPGIAPTRDLRYLCDVRRLRVVRVARSTQRSPSPTTSDLAHALIQLERARNLLGIEKWSVFGACAGSHLALAYVLAHPEAIGSLGLWSVNLGESSQTLWRVPHGTPALFPDLWSRCFPNLVQGMAVSPAIAAALTGTESEQVVIHEALAQWVQHVIDPQGLRADARNPSRDTWRCYLDYCNHAWFCPAPHEWLATAPVQVSAHFMHGRYDLVHAPDSAYLAHQAWPHSRISMVDEAGYDPNSWVTTRELLAWFRSLLAD